MIRLITPFLILMTFNSFPQEFEGFISYEITHNNIDTSIIKTSSMPTKLDFYISGELARIDQFTKIGTQTTIIDTLLDKNILLEPLALTITRI